jgi:hypothetical protein
MAATAEECEDEMAVEEVEYDDDGAGDGGAPPPDAAPAVGTTPAPAPAAAVPAVTPVPAADTGGRRVCWGGVAPERPGTAAPDAAASASCCE